MNQLHCVTNYHKFSSLKHQPGTSPYLCGSKSRGAWLILCSALCKLTSRHCWAASPSGDPGKRASSEVMQTASTNHGCRTEVPVFSMGGSLQLHTMSHLSDGWNLPAWLLHLSIFLPQYLRVCTVTLQPLG